MDAQHTHTLRDLLETRNPLGSVSATEEWSSYRNLSTESVFGLRLTEPPVSENRISNLPAMAFIILFLPIPRMEAKQSGAMTCPRNS